VDHLRERLGEAAPAEARFIHGEEEREWSSDLLRDVSEHRLFVLGRGGDFMLAWRDEGRMGGSTRLAQPNEVLAAVYAEPGLEIAASSLRLQELRLADVPDVGRVQQALFTLVPDEQVEVWLAQDLRVMQYVRSCDGDCAVRGTLADAARVAEQWVSGTFAARLRRGGISTSRNDWYSAVAAEAPDPGPDGMRVRVRTFRHWSDARIAFDGATGEVLSDTVDRLAMPVDGATGLGADAALAAASRELAIPPDAHMEGMQMEERAEGAPTWVARWSHVRDGIMVEGDWIEAEIQPQTGKLVGFQRFWRSADEVATQPAIAAERAVRIVQSARGSLHLGRSHGDPATELMILPFRQRPGVPGPVRVRLAWSVVWSCAHTVYVDAVRGAILHVARLPCEEASPWHLLPAAPDRPPELRSPF
jgi:hypothetical protein